MTPDRQVTTDTYEWHVPMHGPWHATLVAFEKAALFARQGYREAYKLGASDSIFDDAIRVRPDDDKIVIYFDITRKN